ncbi:MAG TPA: hypothetical protein VFF52_28635 [Isosphaeraceae bacterium]|nr:hypothetical protein [Isosphaeraceae bacterium]
MNAPHRRPRPQLSSPYATSIPADQAEALIRRRALQAEQRGYRRTRSDRVPPQPQGEAVGGGRPARWVD